MNLCASAKKGCSLSIYPSFTGHLRKCSLSTSAGCSILPLTFTMYVIPCFWIKKVNICIISIQQLWRIHELIGHICAPFHGISPQKYVLSNAHLWLCGFLWILSNRSLYVTNISIRNQYYEKNIHTWAWCASILVCSITYTCKSVFEQSCCKANNGYPYNYSTHKNYSSTLIFAFFASWGS